MNPLLVVLLDLSRIRLQLLVHQVRDNPDAALVNALLKDLADEADVVDQLQRFGGVGLGKVLASGVQVLEELVDVAVDTVIEIRILNGR